MVGMAGNNRLCEVNSTISAPSHVDVPDCTGIILAGSTRPIVDIVNCATSSGNPRKDSCYSWSCIDSYGACPALGLVVWFGEEDVVGIRPSSVELHAQRIRREDGEDVVQRNIRGSRQDECWGRGLDYVGALW